MSDSPPLLEASNIVKSFPGVKALRGVSIRLEKGEVLSIIGENGAGKSTLMKVLAGVHRPDEGILRMNGEAFEILKLKDATDRGISLIHQELNLAGNLSVGANIFLGREPLKFGLIDNEKIHADAKRFLDAVGLDVPTDRLVEELPIGKQQLVEIAKALSTDARILIMDEPTSSLSTHEAERLFKVIKDLRSKGVSVIYISHRLGEVKELSDRVTVLRDGENAGDLSVEEITHDAMVRLMVGRDISQFYQRQSHEPGDVALKVDRLRTPANPAHQVSFEIRSGEIVGVAGLVGAGRTEMLQSLFGIAPPIEGEIQIKGKPAEIKSPIEAIEAGIALAPEDRKQQGIILEMAVRENMSLSSLKRDQRKGFLNREKENAITSEMIGKMRVKTPGPEQMVQFLSGGNQQKVVLGKWLAMEPEILLLDEPTRGIDIGAKEEIYQLMEELAKRGVAILFVSSEMEEILGMSDRALVMHEGRLTGELKRDELSEEAVMRLATGMTN